MRPTISVPFELKSLSENGEFDGIASPYDVKDLGDDIVDPGAFSKTLAERGDKVRLLDGHSGRIGIASVVETSRGLAAKGKINLEKQAGRDAYSDLKFYQENGQPMGLSIGYQTIKSDMKDGIRHLKEVRLWEISITEFPMNEKALITSVKSADEYESRITHLEEEIRALQATKGTPQEPPQAQEPPQKQTAEPVIDHSLVDSLSQLLRL